MHNSSTSLIGGKPKNLDTLRLETTPKQRLCFTQKTREKSAPKPHVKSPYTLGLYGLYTGKKTELHLLQKTLVETYFNTRAYIFHPRRHESTKLALF